MDYKEKYEQALERAKGLYSQHNVEWRDEDIEYIFPELAGSEDERIRKYIVECVEKYGPANAYPERFRKMIAWLEKQGEQKPIEKTAVYPPTLDKAIDLYYFSYGNGKGGFDNLSLEKFKDIVKTFVEDYGGQKPVFEMKTPEESLGVDSDTYNKIVDECIYGEQKPADKAEPKFKIGDIITNGKIIGKVDENENNKYHGWFGYDKDLSVHYADIPDIEDWHLWTIQDAKDGDVLCTYECDEPKILFILRGTPKKHYALSYHCYYNIMYPHFASDSEKGCLAPNDEDVKPATKEQRDLLFQKMHEAGYEWDVEKKELKKVEQKPQRMISAEAKEALYDKPAWSEEDESRMDNLCHFLEEYGNQYYGHLTLQCTISWLKSLKDRVLPQPKQELSEEDKCMLEHIIVFVSGYAREDVNKEWVSFLKSLRPQNRWKPSELQIEALESATENCAYSEYQDCLRELIEQLKK